SKGNAADTASKKEASAPHELTGGTAALVKLYATGLQRPRVHTVNSDVPGWSEDVGSWGWNGHSVLTRPFPSLTLAV
ncbi:MAG TPA: hypothetical protein VFK06_17205, partial [Candidatus Angelobacter sp.]|nr:hypothetical protein [Candidatus Angelobacter sp.]